MPIRFAFRWLAMLALVLVATAAYSSPAAERAELGQPLLRNFTPREYGAHSQVWAVTQDQRGLIYAGTEDGVLEFDGLRWRLIRTTNRSIARALAVDGAGRVHVGGLREIGYLEPDAAGRMHYVSVLDRLPPSALGFDDVHHIFVRGDGVYYATYARLIRIAGDQVRVWSPKSAFHRGFQVRDRIFIRERGRGLLELVGDELQLVAGGARFAEERVDAMLPFGEDGVLIGSRGSGLFVLDGGGLRAHPTAIDAELASDLLYSGALLEDGRIALGTIQGGVRFLAADGTSRGRIDKPLGLQDDTVYAMCVDRQGGLWLGLDRGLSRIETRASLSRFDERSGLPGGVLSLHRHGGRLYVGTGQGLFRLEPGSDPHFTPIRGIRGQTYALLSVGTRLLAGNNEGTFEVRGDEALQLQSGGTGTTMALHAWPGNPARVLVGLWDGFASLRLENEHWIDEGRIPGISAEVSSFAGAGEDSLWVGTWNSGVLRLRFAAATPTVERFGVEHGLPALDDNYVQRIGGATRWSTNRGIYRFDEGNARFAPDPAFAGLFAEGPRRIVQRAAESSDGSLWMQTLDETRGWYEAGVARHDAAGRYHWAPQTLRALSGSQIEIVFVDADGVVWFGGSDGLVRHDPGPPPAARADYAALLRQVSVLADGRVLQGGAGAVALATLAFADHGLRFDFAAPGFGAADDASFQVWLEGNDRDWSGWSREGFREYTNLHEGNYRFRVRARDLDGVVSREAEYRFRVLPPWYRSTWAWLGYAVLALLLGRLLLRWRLARVEAEKHELEATVALRTGELQTRNRQLEEARTRAEDERHAADTQRARAEEANRAKTVFLANMSHELRTPLNAVLGFAQLMERTPSRSSEDHRHLGTILRSGEHLLDLINDVLSLSRIEAGAMALETSTFDLRALLDNVAELMRMRAEAKDLWLRIELDELPRAVEGDARKLSQVLLNLLGNAVKFTAHGGVTLRASWAQGRAQFVVEDTGPGIAAQEIGQLFEPFVQAESGRAAKEGAGLGLALSRDLARMMDGDIEVQSTPGQGSVFTLSITLAASAGDAPLSERGDRRRVRALAPGQAAQRVLVVDDHDDNRALLAGLLGAVGFEVRTAADGGEALQLWRDWRPQLIWLDKRMPGMDGTEVARRIRAEEQRGGRERVVILALSASALEHQRAEILASGCDDFLSKPCRESRIFARMAEHLGVRYLHDDDGEPAATTAAAAAAAAPVQDRLQGLPAPWIATMRHALALGDTERALATAAEIEARDHDLAAQMRALLAAYRLDELEAMLAAADAPRR
ncbi:MAG: response regulator [Xanthomonadales bacterium]|nr:response regulator [Xanthomonadales bacterium]